MHYLLIQHQLSSSSPQKAFAVALYEQEDLTGLPEHSCAGLDHGIHGTGISIPAGAQHDPGT